MGNIPSNVRFRMIASIDSSFASWFAYPQPISETSKTKRDHVHCKHG